MGIKYIHDSFVHNTDAANKIIPFLIDLFKPENVVDIGCGTGTWLKVCIDNGITDVMGIEGHHLDISKLVIPRGFLVLQDLEKPFVTERKFDMAISLEVAEHLHSNTAEQFVKQLTVLSNVVVFSAAIPYQGGQNHVNEQWLSYWIRLFKKNGYKACDIIRPRFWDTKEVEFWYAQNCCIFINEQCEYPEIDLLPTFHNKNIVHPELLKKYGGYRDMIWKGKVSFSFIARLISKKIRNAINYKQGDIK